MSRISTQAANKVLLNRIFETQKTVFDREIQASSKKKSQTYLGMARSSRRLINVENVRTQLQRSVSNNDHMEVRLELTEEVVDQFSSTISKFRKHLKDYASGEKTDKLRVKFIQDRAFETLKTLQNLLNVDVDGRFLFAGSRTDTEPVDLGVTTIKEFQAKYDGAQIKFPETRKAHLENFSINSDTNNLQKPFVTATNFLQFRRDADGDETTEGSSTIEASSDMFSNIAVGSHITVADTANNNGTYTVESVSEDGRTVTVRTEMLSDEIDSPDVVITYPDPGDPRKTLTLIDEDFGPMNFSRSGDTITAATVNSLARIPVGSTFTVSHSGANNGTYTVAANTGTEITIESKKLTDEAANTSLGTSTFFSYQSDTHINFAAGTNTITVNQNDNATPVPGTFNGLAVGNQITIADTANNNGTFTIDSISADGSQITVAETLNDETENTGATFTGANSVGYDYTSKTEMAFTNNAGAAPDTIQIISGGNPVAGAFSNLSVGQTFNVSGTADQNGSYTISAISPDGSQITINEALPAASVTDTDGAQIQIYGTGGTISATPYFKGDHRSLSHRVNEDRTFELDIFAGHPAFEKAIRGISIILQGRYGTEGGLDQNEERSGQAEYLLESAIERTISGTPPFGSEPAGNLEQVGIDLGFDRVLIHDTNKLHKNLINIFESQIMDLENVDVTETVTSLLNEQRTLEASFQIFSRIRGLSLTNFI